MNRFVTTCLQTLCVFYVCISASYPGANNVLKIATLQNPVVSSPSTPTRSFILATDLYKNTVVLLFLVRYLRLNTRLCVSYLFKIIYVLLNIRHIKRYFAFFKTFKNTGKNILSNFQRNFSGRDVATREVGGGVVADNHLKLFMNKYWGGLHPRSVHLRICSSLDASDGISVIIYAINYYAVILQGSRHYWGNLSKFTYFCDFVTLCQLGYISWFSVQSKACFRFKFSLKCLIKLEF